MLLSWASKAQPDFNSAEKANGLTFFNDIKQKEVYYYLPAGLEMGISENKPDLSFILMRYAGSFTTSDESNSPRFRNILTMRMVMKPIHADSLRAARTELLQRHAAVLLKPLPISQIEAMVVFVPVGAPDTSRIVQRGEMAAETPAGYATAATYWQERYFTLFLDHHSANLLVEAFNKKLSIISFMYAFYSKGVTTKRVLDMSGHGNLDSTLRQQFRAAIPDSAAEDSIRECIIKSDAFVIDADTAKYPGLIKKIDINNAMPPGYAVLNVRNYDFANNLRTDLYEKTVELEATGAGGNLVNQMVRFSIKNQDVTSANFRFKYAVRLDKPYRYRVRELLKDGREIISSWKTMSAWSNLLDITSKPKPDNE